jgi:hypothetical protein
MLIFVKKEFFHEEKYVKSEHFRPRFLFDLFYKGHCNYFIKEALVLDELSQIEMKILEFQLAFYNRIRC